MSDTPSSPAPGEYPTALADLMAEAMKLWDESDGLDPGEEPEDPSLAECIENNWNLSAFLALYLSRRPVEQRMTVMGMTEVEVSYSYEEVHVVDGKTIDTWPPDVEEARDLRLYVDLSGHSFVEDRQEPYEEATVAE